MPSKSAKQRKYNRKTARKNNTLAKTEKSRKQRLSNKDKRDAILAIDPNAKVTIIHGNTYVDGHQVKVEGNMMITINELPSWVEPMLEKDKVNGVYDLVDNDVINPFSDEAQEQRNQAAADYGTAEDAHLETPMRPLTDEEFIEVHKQSEDMKYDLDKITTPVSMWDRLKKKWRAK